MPMMVSTNNEIIQSIPNLLKVLNGGNVQLETADSRTKKHTDEKIQGDSEQNNSDTKNEK